MARQPKRSEVHVRAAGLACVALVSGVATFHIPQPSQPAPASVVLDRASVTHAAAPTATTALAAEPVALAQEAPPQQAPAAARAQESAPEPPQERRGGRRRSRNIWVGPIPTPADWAPPEGPVRIALQAGHWKANEAPPELS